MRARGRGSIAAAIVLLASAAFAAAPTVPTSLPYQGLLLDGLGAPRTGSVGLTLRIWDGLIGGTLVYKQSFPAVLLTDGVFTVQLGPAGEGTDAPSNPLTTSLATALAGDAGATAPVRFLEVTVGGDGALARTQILSSAYAVRASSAANADTATLANDVAQVGGVGSSFVTELFQHVSFDGGDPPNDDPREGLGDVDGDGAANFVDSDNDGDGSSDTTELGSGTDINLVTPVATSLNPSQGFTYDDQLVTVSGIGFQSGIGAVLGGVPMAPTDVTGTSFRMAFAPQALGAKSLQVTNTNGQTTTRSNAFSFVEALALPTALRGGSVVSRTGTRDIAIGGPSMSVYGVGPVAEAQFPLDSRGVIAPAWTPAGALAALHCRANGNGCDIEILRDSDADLALEEETPLVIVSITNSVGSLFSGDLMVDPAGRWVAAYVRNGSNTIAQVAHDRNGDLDFGDSNERVNVEFGAGAPSRLALDSAGRVAFVYQLNSQIRVARDQNGDGDYDDVFPGSGAPELSTLVTGGGSTCLGATFDAADRLVIVYARTPGNVPMLALDANSDGDFSDPGESTALDPGGTAVCDVLRVPGQPLAAVHNAGAGGLKLLLDENGDGDFADAGELQQSFAVSPGTRASLGLNGDGRAMLATATSLVLGLTD